MPPRIADVDARREQIGRAAIEVFARDGFQGASVGDIAALAGLSKGSIYRYFDDKDALFHAAFDAVRIQMLRDCHSVVEEQNRAWDKLAAAVTTSVKAFHSHIAIVPLTLEFWAAASAGETRQRFGTVMADMYREFRELVIALLRQGQAEGDLDGDVDVEAIAAWLVAGVDGLMLQHWFDPAVDPLAGASSMLSTLRRGAANPSAI